MTSALPPLVSTAWLAERLGQSGLKVIDASVLRHEAANGYAWRAAGTEFEADGHIPEARFADLVDRFSDPTAPFPFTRPSAAAFAADATALGLADGDDIVVYDRLDGIWAARLWWLLRSFGHDRAAVLDGGLARWRDEGRPIAIGTTPAPLGHFTATEQPGFFADREEVRAISEGRAPGTLVCSLRPPVFRGDERPYLRPGHIPRSVNVPYRAHIDGERNGFRDSATLASQFAAVTGRNQRIVAYCGGGITAAGTALVLTLLGVPDVAVYDGSLNEWTADPLLPLATGDS